MQETELGKPETLVSVKTGMGIMIMVKLIVPNVSIHVLNV